MNNKINQLGWVVAAGLAGILMAGGFGAQGSKYGVVDFKGVVEKSEFYKNSEQQVKTMQTAREGLLEFLFQYKVATAEQVKRLVELTVKETLSATEKAEMEKLKNDVKALDKDRADITAKANPSAEENARLKGYQERSREIDQTLMQLRDQFEGDLQRRFGEVQNAAVERARTAISEVGKQGGYDVLFRSDFAPYGANDVTDASLKAMNAKK